MLFKENYWKILKDIIKSLLIVNKGQTQGRNLHPFPPHCCSLAVFNVVTQPPYAEEKKDYSSFYSCIEGEVTPFQTERVKLYVIDLALLSPKTSSLSFARSDDHQTLSWTNSVHETSRELTLKK